MLFFDFILRKIRNIFNRFDISKLIVIYNLYNQVKYDKFHNLIKRISHFTIFDITAVHMQAL